MEDGDDYMVGDEKDGEAVCPYFPDHKLRKSRLQYHILQCEKQFTGEVFQCPYNATHRMRMELKETHLQTCSHKAIAERAADATVPQKFNFASADSDSWDEAAAPAPTGSAPARVLAELPPQNHFFPDVKGKTKAQKDRIYAGIRRAFEQNRQPADEVPPDFRGSRACLASGVSGVSSTVSSLGPSASISRLSGIGRGMLRVQENPGLQSSFSQASTAIGGGGSALGELEEEEMIEVGHFDFVDNDVIAPQEVERTNRYGYYQPN